ncbi:hypothetical protein SAMD00019534_036490 [Acytostelium subglobosum LB1]|uniref:hypothetical protein n=1 Tax=Acytostelium subglobosum LB1 TaxID=1410327 RepID=UPI000644A242|nr:hypothetical protein SAMD00019534_036490 [Acytostelium subglobosum LB1]GAM20474.1 hypothetical protein SAMD00019534_036490 [Acytostelium subglobosum LB1]|eukprot:XP_012759995.1 hypothetical protein SAMD00019534_036490 [Acytostelium subglobosum LB1]
MSLSLSSFSSGAIISDDDDVDDGVPEPSCALPLANDTKLLRLLLLLIVGVVDSAGVDVFDSGVRGAGVDGSEGECEAEVEGDVEPVVPMLLLDVCDVECEVAIGLDVGCRGGDRVGGEDVFGEAEVVPGEEAPDFVTGGPWGLGGGGDDCEVLLLLLLDNNDV